MKVGEMSYADALNCDRRVKRLAGLTCRGYPKIRHRLYQRGTEAAWLRKYCANLEDQKAVDLKSTIKLPIHVERELPTYEFVCLRPASMGEIKDTPPVKLVRDRKSGSLHHVSEYRRSEIDFTGAWVCRFQSSCITSGSASASVSWVDVELPQKPPSSDSEMAELVANANTLFVQNLRLRALMILSDYSLPRSGPIDPTLVELIADQVLKAEVEVPLMDERAKAPTRERDVYIEERRREGCSVRKAAREIAERNVGCGKQRHSDGTSPSGRTLPDYVDDITSEYWDGLKRRDGHERNPLDQELMIAIALSGLKETVCRAVEEAVLEARLTAAVRLFEKARDDLLACSGVAEITSPWMGLAVAETGHKQRRLAERLGTLDAASITRRLVGQEGLVDDLLASPPADGRAAAQRWLAEWCDH